MDTVSLVFNLKWSFPFKEKYSWHYLDYVNLFTWKQITVYHPMKNNCYLVECRNGETFEKKRNISIPIFLNYAFHHDSWIRKEKITDDEYLEERRILSPGVWIFFLHKREIFTSFRLSPYTKFNYFSRISQF